MKREFLINILFLVAINILIKPFYLFAIDRGVQNAAPGGDYGLYFALFNFAFLFQVFTDFGVQNYNNRQVAQHSYLLEKYFPTFLILKGLLAVGYLLVVTVLGKAWGFPAAYFPLLLLIAFNQLLSTLVLFLRSNISGLALYRTDSVLSVLDRLMLIVLVGALLWWPGRNGAFQIEWFVWAQTATLSLTALIAFGILRRRMTYFRFRFRPAELWLVLRKSLPFALVIFLMTAYTRIDGVMVERLHPTGLLEADRYASAYRLLDAANALGVLFTGLLYPMFARMLKQKEPVANLTEQGLILIMSGAIPLALACWFFQQEIMEALYRTGDARSGRILGFLMLSYVAICGIQIFGTLLTANGNLKRMNALFLIGVIVNIALNAWLIPQTGGVGAAQATLATQSVVCFAQIWLVRRALSLRIPPATWMRLGLLAGGVVAFGMGLQYASQPWVWRFLGLLGAGGGLVFLLGLIRPRSLLLLVGGKITRS